MTVAELIALLQKCSPDAKILMPDGEAVTGIDAGDCFVYISDSERWDD